MNFGKGISFPIQPGDEASLFWMGVPSQRGSCGLPIDSHGNLVGSSNWQGFTGGDGGTVYQQPTEVQNHNTTVHNFSGAGQVGVPGVAGDSSGDRSHGLNQISDLYGQPLGLDDGSQNSSWEELLTLMKAPSAVPDDIMANNSRRAANGLCVPPPRARAAYAVRESGAGGSSVNVPAGGVMPSSHAQGVNLMQYMMKATAMANRNEIANKSCLSANGYGVPNAYSQECSNQMRPNAASPTPLDQSHYIALVQRQRNSSSSILQDGVPVSSQPHHNPNYTNVGAASSISGISPQFAPLTPQQTKGKHQYPATTSLPVLRDLNQRSVLQNNLAASSAEFAPATPQTVKITDHHQSPAAPNPSIHQVQNQDGIQQECLAASIENGSTMQNSQEIVHKVLDSSSAAVGTLFAERNSSDNEGNNEIDMNNTPSKKTPKRRKHRPKVKRENKPPRRQQPAKAKMGPDGTPVPKRKYVRKNKSSTAETPQTDYREKADNVAKPTSQSCRRSLNFEMEDNVMDRTNLDGQGKGRSRTGENNFLNVNVQEAGLLIGSNRGRGLNSHPQCEQGPLIHGNKEAGITAGHGQSVRETRQEKSPQWNQHMHQSQLIMRDLLMGNSYMRTSNEAEGATHCFKTTANDVSANQTLYAAVSQSQLQQITIPENIQRTRQRLLMLAEERQRRALEHIQSRGYKRDFGCTKENEGFGDPTNKMSSQSLCKELFDNDHNWHNSRLGQYSLETYKKKKIERLQHTVNSSIQASARFAEMCSSHIQTNINTVNHFEEMNGGLLKTHRSDNFRKPNSDLCIPSSGLNADSALPHAYPSRQPISSEVSLGKEMQTGREGKISALAHVTNSLKAQACCMRNKMPEKSFSGTATLVTETINRSSHAIVSAKKHTGAPIQPKLMANNSGSHAKQKNMISVDDITYQLEYLNLNSTKGMVSDDQKALVIYNADGTIIPYEGFDPLKRRKPRPKVDIDAETNRLWNFLMGKEASNDEKQTDEQKAKYWEEERKVFRGRADSFIARMHLVQGDRRFSPWKGSVVDSVIGVFLTQNVTDHLSSSAFMSLAARFPPRSNRRDIASGSNKPDMLVGEPEICIIEINDNIEEDQKLTNQAVYSKTPCEPSDQQKQMPASVDRIQPSVKASKWRSDEVISSQDSSESANGYTNGAVQSLHESDPKADCPANGLQPISRYSSTGSAIEDIENFIRFPNFASQESGRSYQETDTSGHLQLQNAEANKQKLHDGVDVSDFTTDPFPFDLNRPHLQAPDIPFTSSWFPMVGGLETYDIDCCDMLSNQQDMSLYSSAASEYMGVTSIGIDQQVQGSIPSLQTRTWSTEPPTENPHTSQRKNIDQKNGTGMAANYQHHQTNYYGPEQDKNLNTHFESKPDKEPHHRQSTMVESDITVDELQVHASSNQDSIYAANKAAESKLIEQGHSSLEASGRTEKNVPKEKGRKATGDKERAIDWDSLRKEVKSSGRLRERSLDSMDSLDYEALRHADIRDISDAIKERGMNIMLADRMKAFLNRIVGDHGSIDLEWLRDAPPDKAKDYLLSIRGLGLKSVECIRLLTLHQHAFPVDTNVGRIAVRLGWVPLQPLPESLQLHLLEMYPVLESIQKYLWPRLCTLDQRTLYELHYQLITFGKVFCTKSKPNCNACPMRGECRHFASAFASSRLALPGPEEKSIVASDIPAEISRNPPTVVTPMPLHSLQNVPPEEATVANKTCEPIVEEPATPEPDVTEFSLADIEDAFYEDPDEIPTIRLNVEEFTQNLQNFMQENMELQEADMSKALVALNPNAASIPTPKLKNVSRLRTEHQVYELPDSHPLLRELDKREPDDPSPYLLAIWTPGETANSIQPSEGTCGFQESGKLCSEKTCFTCNSIRESNSQTVRGTLLIPCRTAMRGKFPLNGTYFQVNEVFADHESSLNPIDVPRAWIWNLPRRTVYFGTTVTTIFRGMSTEEIQYSFWRGSVCVRGFDQKTRAPRPLIARLHFPASKQVRGRKEIKKNKKSVGGRTEGTGNGT